MGKRPQTSFEAPPFNRVNRKERRQQEADRLTAVGLMLGAEWVRGGAYFMKARPMPLPPQYWDRWGNPMTSVQASIRKGVTPRGNPKPTITGYDMGHSKDATAYAMYSRPRGGGKSWHSRSRTLQSIHDTSLDHTTVGSHSSVL